MNRYSETDGIAPRDAEGLHGVCVLDSDPEIEELLSVLTDADCRSILEAIDDEALSAEEISEVCDLPLSSTYRKLDKLTGTALIEEGTRVCKTKKHVREYSRLVESVGLSFDEEGNAKLRLTSSLR